LDDSISAADRTNVGKRATKIGADRSFFLVLPALGLWAMIFSYVTRKGEHGDKADPPLVSQTDLGKRGNAKLVTCDTRAGLYL
jgi:hypothetical protein